MNNKKMKKHIIKNIFSKFDSLYINYLCFTFKKNFLSIFLIVTIFLFSYLNFCNQFFFIYNNNIFSHLIPKKNSELNKTEYKFKTFNLID